MPNLFDIFMSQAQAQEPVQPAEDSGFTVTDTTPEELEYLQAFNVADTTDAERFQLQEQNRGIMTRVMQRALGTDVNDPLELERMGAVLAGGIGGAWAGSKIPPLGPMGVFVNPITGAIAGGFAGVVAGAVAPEATMETMEALGLIPEGTRDASGLSNEELRRIVAGETLLEAMTGGVAAFTRLAGRATTAVVTPTTREGRQLAEEAAQQGINLAPFQVSGRGLGRGIINTLGRFPIIGAEARRLGARQEQIWTRIIQDPSFRIGPLLANTDLGVQIWEDAGRLLAATNEHFSIRYGDLFRRANEIGIVVDPNNSMESARAIVEELTRRAPPGADGQVLRGAAATEYAKEFLVTEVTAPGLGPMTLGQIDEFLAKIDQHIASADPEIRNEVWEILSPFKGAAKSDITENIRVRSPTNARTNQLPARQIAIEMAAIDAEFAEIMTEIFESSVSKRFQTVRRRGLRGAALPSEEQTRIPIDRLLPIVMDMKSPMAMAQLRSLVTTQTMNDLATLTIANAFAKATTRVDGMLDLNANGLARELGFSGADVGRRQAMEVLMQSSPYTIKELETMVEGVRLIQDVPIPDVNTFMARRTVLGGRQAIINGLFPFLSIGVVGGGSAAAGFAGAAVGLSFLGGSRLLVSAISNPLNVRAFRTVMNEEASTFVRRAAWTRMARVGINGLQEIGEISQDEASVLVENLAEVSRRIFPDEEQE